GAPIAARVFLPAPARVPTIVARFDSASTEPTDQAAIRALATAMIEDHDVTIVLEGHSDMRGGDDYNHTISLERANWVKSRLVALGVSADRIETVGLGATRPLRSDEPDAPSVNRRVEVRWLGSATRGDVPPSRPVPKSSPSREPVRDVAVRAPRDASAEAASAPSASPDAGASSRESAPPSAGSDPRPEKDAAAARSERGELEGRSPSNDKESLPSSPPGESPQPGVN
ncbi:MAG: OmpA/MotB domain protein, partial [Labilithrix sp.]|nr:OmpA/MotB domain protein [Labilithrix sp.]